MKQYRRPPAKAQTSVRINALLRGHLIAGGTATLATCSKAMVTVAGESREADLSLKRERVLAEHAALVAEAGTQVTTIANL